ncbi:MAG TPA: hypothetical protein VHF89_12640 [Solirubrobacteraceae bacterium]|nr:hypothetical protein [Solirubrobacteraceae bacterium]
MSHARRLMLALAATCLVAALAAAPTAGAAAKSSSAAKATASFAPDAQTSQSRRTLARRIRSVRRRTARAERRLRALGQTLESRITELRTAFQTGDTNIDNKINGIVGAVTPILQELGNGLMAAGNGLRALEAGVRELAAATTAGFGEVETALTDIGDFLGATEYGFAQILVGANAQGGSFVVTPDLPDTVQQAMTAQHFVAQHSGDIVVLYGVRSGENDGTGADNPAAHCRVTVVNEDASEVGSTAANPGLGNLPFQPVNDRSALTSENPNNSGFPFGLKTNDNGNDEEDKTTTLATTVTVAAGDVYEVSLSCVDISADADDPEA